jgi:excisionase family DNA binding protein
MADELLTTGQVARYLGVNVSVARRWMATGHLPAVLVDGGWRVRADELDA